MDFTGVLVEDAGGHLRAHIRGVLDLGLPGRHILADVRKGPLDLVDVLLGSSVQRQERSLAGGVDLVSEDGMDSAHVRAARPQVPAAFARSSATSKALPFMSLGPVGTDIV
jgi:hypothetical protein